MHYKIVKAVYRLHKKTLEFLKAYLSKEIKKKKEIKNPGPPFSYKLIVGKLSSWMLSRVL